MVSLIKVTGGRLAGISEHLLQLLSKFLCLQHLTILGDDLTSYREPGKGATCQPFSSHTENPIQLVDCLDKKLLERGFGDVGSRFFVGRISRAGYAST